MPSQTFILTFACDDMPGIVANVTNHIFKSGGNILESHQYNDIETNRFFMRTAYRFADPAGSAPSSSARSVSGRNSSATPHCSG